MYPDPTTPVIVGSDSDTSNYDFPHAVEVIGGYLNVVASNNRFTIIDVADPSAPSIIGSRQDATNHLAPADVAIKGQYAYVSATDSDSIAIYKLGNKANGYETGYNGVTTR